MVLEEIGRPLALREVPCPEPGVREVLIKVEVCGVCRTDVHIADGELPSPKLPLIMGHQIVGKVESLGPGVTKYAVGQSVGVAWLAKSCQRCSYCLAGNENLCDAPDFTGYTLNGGYAEYAIAHEDYIYRDVLQAPLLCAGLIGYRTFKLAGFPKTAGYYGFGSSAHIILQAAQALASEGYVFTRPGDTETQAFARTLGAVWAGGSDELPSKPLDAALIFAPVGALMPQALKAVKKGGKVISAGIHMSDIPSFPYRLLWEERSLASVANLTRADGREFFDLIQKVPLHLTTTSFPLEKANEALDAIRKGGAVGSIVLCL